MQDNVADLPPVAPMSDPSNRLAHRVIVVVQCRLVVERCPGYYCIRAAEERTGAMATYPSDTPLRLFTLDCGGCCGRAVHRKLDLLCRTLAKKEGLERSQITVHLATCITHDNFHGPPCPHLDYLKALIGKLNLTIREGTHISQRAQSRRSEGIYMAHPEEPDAQSSEQSP